jgi:dihydrofolate reductase
MIISLIAAMDLNRGIGFDGKILWHLPSDLIRFKNLTMGHHIVMGRKTYESIGRSLPDRKNIVLSRNKDFKAPGCIVVHTLDEAVKLAATAGEDELFVIGGEKVFAIAIAKADKLYLSIVNTAMCADVFFPLIFETDWKEIIREEISADDKNEYAHVFRVLVRRV